MPEKLDSTGKPFRIRERGGKSTHRQKDLQERVARGEFIPKKPWTEQQPLAHSKRVGSQGSGSGCEVVSEGVEGGVPVSSTGGALTRSPQSADTPPDNPAKVPRLTTTRGAGESLSAASSGSLGFGSGCSSGSSVVPRTPCDPKAGSKQSARPEAEAQKPSRATRDTSYRITFDYHGVLDDHEDNFTQTSRKFIRELLNTSVFVEVLILSYIGVHGPHSQTRRENLQRQAFEFQRSLGRAGSRFGVAIVPSKRQKALVCRDTLPVLFCDDQKPLVESCRPHCKLAEQIGPQNSLEQAVAKAEALRIPPSVTPRAWKELIQAPIV